MYWFVWSFFSRVEVFVGIRIDLYFCCVALSSRLLFVGGGGVSPFCLADFVPRIDDRYGVGVCGMVYLMADC